MEFQPIKIQFEDTLKEEDYGVASDHWNSGETASRALIIDFVGTPYGFEALKTIVSAGLRDVNIYYLKSHLSSDELVEKVQATQAIQRKIHDALTTNAHRLDDMSPEENDFDEELQAITESTTILAKHNTAINEGIKNMLNDLAAHKFFRDQVSSFVSRLGTVDRVHQSLDRFNTQYGVHYKLFVRAVKELTVGIKCLDYTWGEMRIAYRCIATAYEAVVAAGNYEFSLAEFAAYKDEE